MDNKLTIKNDSKTRRGFLGDVTKWVGGTALLAAAANVFTSSKVMADSNSTLTTGNDHLGSIGMVGFNFAPRGYAFCDGQLLSIASYSALFSLLGTTYGGDGRTTFALPDLRGRVPIHTGGYSGNGPGLSPYSLGQKGGQENVTLNTNQIPAHNHTLRVKNAGGNSDSPISNSLASNSEGIKHYSTEVTDADANSSSIANNGGGQSHANIQPYLAINFVIALTGIFPSRS